MKERIDKLLVEKGYFDTRERARAYIIAGNVIVNGEKIIKPSRKIDKSSNIELKLLNDGFVSRGGIKLQHALKEFVVDVNGKRCMDIGASTGGFTDCLLKNGAKSVIAIDVGKGLIYDRLRRDSRVIIVEKFNARYIDKLKLKYKPDFTVIDVSFISLTLILKPLFTVIEVGSEVIALIKPQFELEKPYKGFKGVVKDPELHKNVLWNLHLKFKEYGYNVKGYTFSPIRGQKGNIEFFVYLVKGKKIDSMRIDGYSLDYFKRLVDLAQVTF